MPLKHFDNAELGIAFDLPENPTVLQVLTADSAMIEYRELPTLVGLWECAKPLISNWTCETLPDITVPLTEMTGILSARIVTFTANCYAIWRSELNEVSKN